MLLNKSEASGDTANTFYSPISKYGYLTPAQRKKLREKRNLSPLKEYTINKPLKTKHLIKKSKHKIHSKSKWKVQTKELLYKKVIKPNLPEVRCTAAQLIVTKNNDTVKKKFFKTRSPEHFKKANFVVPLVYKPNRLDFTSGKHSDSHKFQSVSNSNHSLENISEVRNNIVFSRTVETPTVVYVFPFHESDKKSCELLPSCPDEELSHEKLLFDIQQSFMNSSDPLVLVPKIDCSEKTNDSEVLNTEMESKTPESEESKSPKLYPIFYKQKVKEIKPESTRESAVVKKTFCMKDTSKGSEQMIIDAGQKEIGAKQCKTCNMIYFIGQAVDEKLHSEYHDLYLVSLRFPGWKNEQVVGNFEDGRVIKVAKDDSKKLKKVQDVLLIANRDLGFPSNELPERPNLTFLLFISNDKKVKGCLVAESITSASPIVLEETFCEKNKQEKEKVNWEIGSWYASSETVPAICGINRIWVAKDYRRHKVASRLIDCLRNCFIFGYVVSLQELAFTDPSPDGRNFAASYTGNDNFLVYK